MEATNDRLVKDINQSITIIRNKYISIRNLNELKLEVVSELPAEATP